MATKPARVSRNLSISEANDQRLSREAGDRVLNPGVLVDVALERWFAELDLADLPQVPQVPRTPDDLGDGS